MDLELTRFNRELFDQTKEEWEKQLTEYADDVFTPVYYQKLDWVEKRLNDDTGTIHVYAITDKDKGDAVIAIIELSHAMPKSTDAWLKLLNVTVQPMYDTGTEIASASDLALIARTCILEAYVLIYDEHPSATLKVLGNNTLSVDFLKGIALGLKEKGFEADTKGGWLVINKIDIDN